MTYEELLAKIKEGSEAGRFYKNNPTDQIWWVDTSEWTGYFLFSFDRKTVFNLFADYPHKLTANQKELFDKENPFWADFFKDRGFDHEPQKGFGIRKI